MVKLFPWEWRNSTTPNKKLLRELKALQPYFSVVRVKAEAEPWFFTYYYQIILVPLTDSSESEKEAADQDRLDFMAARAAIEIQTSITRYDFYKGIIGCLKLR